jgi:hypothetical protein
MGFSVLNKDGEDRPQCVLCCEVLSNESMKPLKFRCHLEAKHGESVNKPIEYFQNKKLQLCGSQNLVKDIVCGTKNEKAVLASYEAALLIARNGNPIIWGSPFRLYLTLPQLLLLVPSSRPLSTPSSCLAHVPSAPHVFVLLTFPPLLSSISVPLFLYLAHVTLAPLFCIWLT